MYSESIWCLTAVILLLRLILVALLSGCRNYKNIDLAEEVHRRMLQHFPEAHDSMTAATVLLANTVASSGDTDKAWDVRMLLNRPDVRKTVGLSWTTVNSKFYVSQRFPIQWWERRMYIVLHY